MGQDASHPQQHDDEPDGPPKTSFQPCKFKGSHVRARAPTCSSCHKRRTSNTVGHAMILIICNNNSSISHSSFLDDFLGLFFVGRGFEPLLLAFPVGMMLKGNFLFKLENIFGDEGFIVVGFVFFKECSCVHVEDLLRCRLQ